MALSVWVPRNKVTSLKSGGVRSRILWRAALGVPEHGVRRILLEVGEVAVARARFGDVVVPLDEDAVLLEVTVLSVDVDAVVANIELAVFQLVR
jgi:hypothetical protein